MHVIDVGIQSGCALLGNHQLKSNNCVEVETEHREPVGELIVCDVTECEDLADRGDRHSPCQVVIQVVRDIKLRRTAKEFSGPPRNAVESQAAY